MSYFQDGGNVKGVSSLMRGNPKFSYEIDPIMLKGQGTASTWNVGSNYLSNSLTMMNGFMKASENWTHQVNADDMAWKLSGVRADGPAKMIGGTGDPLGVFDIAGEVMSNWKPENRYAAMALGVIVAVALKKPGLAINEEYNISSRAIRSALSDRSGKRGFSEVGYQFQKHYGRGGNWEIPQGVKKNPAMFNKAGYDTFKEIWKAPGSFQNVGGFIEKRLLDGRGIRFQENWKFKGFLD